MIDRRKIYYIVFVAIFLLSGASFFNMSIKADSSASGNIFKKTKFSFENQNYELISYTKQSFTAGHKLIKKTGFLSQDKSIELKGFETDVELCKKRSVNLGTKDHLCVEGVVGVHSKNIQLINSETLVPLNFYTENAAKSLSITSDVPSISFSSAERDPILYIDNRNYDLDPVVNIIRSYYDYKNDGYYFDKAENLE